jgi:hypothetical protein
MLRDACLRLIIGNDCAHQNVGVSRNFHSSPAQPRAMTSFISSIEIALCPSRFNKPKA